MARSRHLEDKDPKEVTEAGTVGRVVDVQRRELKYSLEEFHYPFLGGAR
jgi:hypothetical protein